MPGLRGQTEFIRRRCGVVSRVVPQSETRTEWTDDFCSLKNHRACFNVPAKRWFRLALRCPRLPGNDFLVFFGVCGISFSVARLLDPFFHMVIFLLEDSSFVSRFGRLDAILDEPMKNGNYRATYECNQFLRPTSGSSLEIAIRDGVISLPCDARRTRFCAGVFSQFSTHVQVACRFANTFRASKSWVSLAICFVDRRARKQEVPYRVATSTSTQNKKKVREKYEQGGIKGQVFGHEQQVSFSREAGRQVHGLFFPLPRCFCPPLLAAR